MRYFKFKPDADNGFQAYCNHAPDSLLKKDLYKNYEGDSITGLLRDPKTKLTDILNEGTLSLKGIIVSKKFKDIVLKFNIHHAQFIPINDEKLSNYYFMFFNGELISLIDYERTSFKIQEWDPNDIIYLDATIPKNKEGVMAAYKEYCAESVFNSLAPIDGYFFEESPELNELDLFRIGYFDLSFYISERLKKELEESGITGWKAESYVNFTI